MPAGSRPRARNRLRTAKTAGYPALFRAAIAGHAIRETQSTIVVDIELAQDASLPSTPIDIVDDWRHSLTELNESVLLLLAGRADE